MLALKYFNGLLKKEKSQTKQYKIFKFWLFWTIDGHDLPKLLAELERLKKSKD
jgi:hypothetical protein